MRPSLPFACLTFGTVLGALTAAFLPAQTLSIEEYEPKSTLVVPEHPTLRARFPFIDVHNHQDTAAAPADIDQIVRDMDAMNMRVMVNLSGGSGDALASGVRNWKGRHPRRFVTFANLDFAGIDEPGWGTRTAGQLERDVRQGGAQGLKIFKNFGLTVKDRRLEEALLQERAAHHPGDDRTGFPD